MVCRLCHSSELVPFLDFVSAPPADSFLRMAIARFSVTRQPRSTAWNVSIVAKRRNQ